MEEAQVERTVTLPIFDEEETKEASNPRMIMIDHQPPASPVSRYKWWIKVTIFSLLVLGGEATSVLLLQLYYRKGGNSKWMSTLAQTGGFPVLLPLIFFFPAKKQNNSSSSRSSIALIYIFLGLILASLCALNSMGLANLPVSTFTLIYASQLAFNALFSYFLNTQKFTPLIINSLVLLTMSSTLLVFQQNDHKQAGSTTSKAKYATGFVCAVGGAVTTGLFLAVSQFSFRKIFKSTTFRVMLDLIIYENLVATILIVIGLFGSGEWKSIKGEMEGYELGRGLYVLTLVGIAMSLQVNIMGLVGLVFEVSSLFSNVISALAVPIVPILAVVLFHDKMSGVKVIAMLLAIWGIASYIYQEYQHDSHAHANANAKQVSVNSLIHQA